MQGQVKEIKAVIHQVDYKNWRCLILDNSNPAKPVFLTEETGLSRIQAEEFAQDMEDFYVCGLDVNVG
jgi:hypothetical protein